MNTPRIHRLCTAVLLALTPLAALAHGMSDEDRQRMLDSGYLQYLGMASPNLLWAVFVFGLLHGFGLSTRLQELPLGEDKMAMLWRILSFNLGVELGQIAALTVMVALLAAWRRRASFARFSHLANLALIFAGIYLLFTQLHGYQHDADPDGFRFPEAMHQHVHEDMKVTESIDPKRNTP